MPASETTLKARPCFCGMEGDPSVSAGWPGGVDTALQTRIRGQDPGRIGAGLHERFNKNFADGTLITPEHSAAALLAHLAGDDTGAIWDVSIAPVRT